MKTIKMILFFVSPFLFHITTFAQEKVTFGYDAAGNRISRTLVVPDPRLLASEKEEEEETTVYSEVLSELLIKLYPNPTRGLIYIEIQNLPLDVTAYIALYRLSGELIVSRQSVSYSTEIDITGQAPGVYILKIIAGKEQTEWKIIKQ
jgi:hypothetical protein